MNTPILPAPDACGVAADLMQSCKDAPWFAAIEAAFGREERKAAEKEEARHGPGRAENRRVFQGRAAPMFRTVALAGLAIGIPYETAKELFSSEFMANADAAAKTFRQIAAMPERRRNWTDLQANLTA